MEAAPFHEVSKKPHLRTSVYITWSDPIGKDDKECYLLAEHIAALIVLLLWGKKEENGYCLTQWLRASAGSILMAY